MKDPYGTFHDRLPQRPGRRNDLTGNRPPRRWPREAMEPAGPEKGPGRGGGEESEKGRRRTQRPGRRKGRRRTRRLRPRQVRTAVDARHSGHPEQRAADTANTGRSSRPTRQTPDTTNDPARAGSFVTRVVPPGGKWRRGRLPRGPPGSGYFLLGACACRFSLIFIVTSIGDPAKPNSSRMRRSMKRR
ncbi:hypothetical protein GCM10010517_04730 [Streptosporangium fragile]|uniref:Uncharacterized protein n=1 Tax=Streptosporangium fragile TaxID=46186 RepID=A0ABN3VPQ0_9ACTN